MKKVMLVFGTRPEAKHKNACMRDRSAQRNAGSGARGF